MKTEMLIKELKMSSSKNTRLGSIKSITRNRVIIQMYTHTGQAKISKEKSKHKTRTVQWQYLALCVCLCVLLKSVRKCMIGWRKTQAVILWPWPRKWWLRIIDNRVCSGEIGYCRSRNGHGNDKYAVHTDTITTKILFKFYLYQVLNTVL